VTEFAHKGSLTALLKARDPPRPEVARPRFYSIVHGVAKGMEFVHGRGCVHRDLKVRRSPSSLGCSVIGWLLRSC
jgi:serine/threonine protein kinase